ncbi:MAG: response regulator transcription factor [Sulfuricurvum sp.]|uniref:response regulator transcription factor n=1 Tax=Sulfuricurvum sp. TaxID=2025608 RepID=UPI0025EFA8FB|nr:response regulator transcription factor [Sulfuricurvum sp.]MBV5320299.1 response regulator transcription factor [Sulfuricurvum sp.]
MLSYLKDKTILFVEDNVEFAANTTTLLKIFVEQVIHASTLAEAHDVLVHESIDIIITDIKLKNENGIDFIRDVRSADNSTPIIIISGHKDEAFLFRSIPLNLTAYLLKPIKYEDLIDAMERCSEKLKVQNETQKELKEGWVYESETKTLLKENQHYSLNKKEALFMELLSINRDRLITKEMLQSSVWIEDEMSDSAITNFIMRIRRRFGKDFIYTIPDLGYRFKL